MSKPFAYWIRLSLVTSLCSLTTFSPALACRLIDRLRQPVGSGNCCEIVVPPCNSIPTCEVPGYYPHALSYEPAYYYDHHNDSPSTVMSSDCDEIEGSWDLIPQPYPTGGDHSHHHHDHAHDHQSHDDHSHTDHGHQDSPSDHQPTPAQPDPTPAAPVVPTPVESTPAVKPPAEVTAPAVPPAIQSTPIVEPAVVPEPALAPATSPASAAPVEAAPAELEPEPSSELPLPEGEPDSDFDVFDLPSSDNTTQPAIPSDSGALPSTPAVPAVPAVPFGWDDADESDASDTVPPTADDLDTDAMFGGTAEDNDVFGEPAVEPTTEDSVDSFGDDLFDNLPSSNDPADLPLQPEGEDEMGGLFGSDSPAVDAFDDESATADSMDDVFGEPAADDVFDANPSEAEPAPGAADPFADLFGESASDAAPSTPAADSESLDDLFQSTPDATPDAAEGEDLEDIFGGPSRTQEAEPAAPPASQESTMDELFDPPASDTPAPVEPKDELDQLFGGVNSDSKSNSPEAPAADDDFFGRPVSNEADAKPIGSYDDIFGPIETNAAPEVEPTQPAAPAQEPEKTEAPIDAGDLESLFGISSFTPDAEFKGADFKTWVDNTGTFSVNARLAVIYADKVKLIKENGKTTTVSLSRLSDRDFAYVQWVASNLMRDDGTKLVQHDTKPSAF